MRYILETGCECFKREANKVTHNLNKYAIHVPDFFMCIEEVETKLKDNPINMQL